MTTSQGKTRQRAEQVAQLSAETRRGRLIPGQREGFLELDTADERFELLGPFDIAAYEGDEVEVEGVLAPSTRAEDAVPALLVRHVRRVQAQSSS